MGTLALDIEIAPGDILVGFTDVDTQRTWTTSTLRTWQPAQIRRLLSAHRILTFNGIHYDIPVLQIALERSVNAAYRASVDIIQYGKPYWEVLKAAGIRDRLRLDHIDIKGPAFGKSSLKLYAARLGARNLQDLPFDPHKPWSVSHYQMIARYCDSDREATILLANDLKDAIALREDLGKEFLSLPDQKVAENLLCDAVKKRTGTRPEPATIAPGTHLEFNIPAYIKSGHPSVQDAVARVRASDLVVGPSGHVQLPALLAATRIRIGMSSYAMGIGGLHSTETSVTRLSDERITYRDADVASYYPSLILQAGLEPASMQGHFLDVYAGMRDERLHHKRALREIKSQLSHESDTAARIALDKQMALHRAGDKVGKVALVSSFGKFGDRFSPLYAPHLLTQVTLSGQLAILVLIGDLEQAGIDVVSANTDGIVAGVPADKESLYAEICDRWQRSTGLGLEYTDYRAVYSRDVNSYIAIKADGSVKRKGAYSAPDQAHNPAGEIVIEALIAFLTRGTPLADTVLACDDPLKFAYVRTVKEGAIHAGVRLGKVVRFAIGKGLFEPIRYAISGNKVPGSDGAYPMMSLADVDIRRIDKDAYIRRAERMLLNDFEQPEQLDLFS